MLRVWICSLQDTQNIIPAPAESGGARARPGELINRVKYEVNKVKGEQQKWKGTVKEQRRHIYDTHTMLNWHVITVMKWKGMMREQRRHIYDTDTMLNQHVITVMKWKGTMREQRRHIYDTHTMLNWHAITVMKWKGTMREQRRHIYDIHTMLNWHVITVMKWKGTVKGTEKTHLRHSHHAQLTRHHRDEVEGYGEGNREDTSTTFTPCSTDMSSPWWSGRWQWRNREDTSTTFTPCSTDMRHCHDVQLFTHNRQSVMWLVVVMSITNLNK